MLRTTLQAATRRAGRCRTQQHRVSLCPPSWFQNGLLVHPPSNEESNNNQRSIEVVPRIISLPTRQFSSTAGNNDGDKTNTSMTMRERRSEASKAAKKGARSAGTMFRTYGPVFVGTYLSVYAATLGSIFLGIESGGLDPAFVLSQVSSNTEEAKSTVQVIVEFLDHYAWTRPAVPILERNPELANFGVAWVATKFTEPVRLAITFPIVPRVARATGWTKLKDEHLEEEDGTEAEVEAGDTPAGKSKENI